MVRERGQSAPVILWLLFTLGASQALLEVSGREGHGVVLPCGSGEVIGDQRRVTWRRFGSNVTLATLTTGSGETFRGRLSLIHNGGLSLLLYNVTLTDRGAYSCSNRELTGNITNLLVKDNCTMDDMFSLNSTANQRSAGPNEFPTGTLSACAGDDVWIPCRLTGNGPYRWEGQREPHDQEGVSKLLDRVLLHPGYGVSLVSGASLVIFRLRQRHGGIYTCRTNRMEYGVKLRVEKPGFWELLLEWWIPLTTVSCALFLYASVLALIHRLRRS
ncbi:uncharacterized protein LOC144489625 [Mustelus asterias]